MSIWVLIKIKWTPELQKFERAENNALYSGGTHAEIFEIVKWSLTIKIELHFGILRFHADEAADEIRIEMKVKWTRNGREMGYSE